MEIKELEKLIDDGLNEVKSKVDTVTKETKSELTAEIKALEQKLEEVKGAGATLEYVEKMQSQLNELELSLKNKVQNTIETKSIREQLGEIFNEEKTINTLKELSEKSNTNLRFEIKAVGTIFRANYTGSIGTTYFDSEIAKAPKRKPFLRDIVRSFPVNADTITFVDKFAKDGGAGMTAEGAKKSQIDWRYEEKDVKVQKATCFVKVSKEALQDLAFLQSEINGELMDEVKLKLDSEIYNGNGTAPELKGILTYVSDMVVTGTPFNAKIDKANEFDVLRVAAALIANNGFQANYALVNPMDSAKMDLTKSSEGVYIMPPFTTVDGQNIAGLTVVENTGVAVGSFVVGDFSKSNLAIREEVNINIGYENDDFTKNLVTILAEMRAAHYIKEQHKKAFVKGTFESSITFIAKPTV